jgi:tetratricopeptide (TPR) repeat protein
VGPRSAFPLRLVTAAEVVGTRLAIIGNAANRLHPVAGQGLKRSRRFLQFRALATYQGLAIIPMSDGLAVETSDSGVIVRDAAGLLVSPGADRDRKLRDNNDFESGLRLFDLEDWRRPDRGSLSEVRQALLDSVVAAPPEGVDAARLDLARFYFAHGLATEALAVLRLISNENERLASDPQVRLLRGASEFLGNNYERAAEMLNDPVLAGERDALPWQGAIAAISRDWLSAVVRFDVSAPLIADYAPRVRARLRLLAAEARLAVGDSDGASLYLEEVLEEDPNMAERAQLDFLLGRRAKMDGDTAAARSLWLNVAAGSHRPSRARARLALVELGLETGSLLVKDAIAGLERLRSDWRGDGFELVLLQRLAELHVASGDYGSALGTLREAVSAMPDSPYAAEARARLGEVFTEVILGGSSESFAPPAALSLTQEFKDLIPAGPDGDRLIAHLADRLVEADQFDEAATLLADQVAHRLHGEEKVRTGARLAWIRLLEPKPVLVLTALNASLPEAGFASLPEQLERDRRHLRARALALLGRTAEAMALLDGDDSDDALRLNAEFLWADKDWQAAAGILEKLAPPPADGLSLSEADSEVLHNLAVAYSLSGQQDDLSRIGGDYGGAMAATAWRDDFARLTGELEEERVTDADELAATARFEVFMSRFKDRLASGEPDRLN